MFTLEERSEHAFARFWAHQPRWWIEGLMRMSMQGHPEVGDGFHAERRAAVETMALHLVREHVGRVWRAREAARARHREQWAAALAGEVTDDDRGQVQALAEDVDAGRVAEVAGRIRKRWPFCGILDFPWSGPSGAARYRAAVLLRNAGEADAAYLAFVGCRNEWYYRRDGGFPIQGPLVRRSGSWRYGVPPAWAPGSAVGPPVYESFDMRQYEWVIGYKPLIHSRTLTVLGVPRSHQLILDPGAGLPPLRGRVAIVDDVFDGMGSSCLAQVYDADVIDIGTFLDDGDSWEYPVCTIWEDRLTWALEGKFIR